MDKKLAARWVKALRSGRYRQCRIMAQNSDGHNCCLGVLGRILRVKGLVYNSCNCPLPSTIVSESIQIHFASMNDNGKSFKQIADAIETELLGGDYE